MFLKKGSVYKSIEQMEKEAPNKAKLSKFDNPVGSPIDEAELRKATIALDSLGYGKQIPLKFTIAEEFIRQVILQNKHYSVKNQYLLFVGENARCLLGIG